MQSGCHKAPSCWSRSLSRLGGGAAFITAPHGAERDRGMGPFHPTQASARTSGSDGVRLCRGTANARGPTRLAPLPLAAIPTEGSRRLTCPLPPAPLTAPHSAHFLTRLGLLDCGLRCLLPPPRGQWGPRHLGLRGEQSWAERPGAPVASGRQGAPANRDPGPPLGREASEGGQCSPAWRCPRGRGRRGLGGGRSRGASPGDPES